MYSILLNPIESREAFVNGGYLHLLQTERSLHLFSETACLALKYNEDTKTLTRGRQLVAVTTKDMPQLS